MTYRIATAAAVVALSVSLSGRLALADEPTLATLKPRQGISLDVGAKRAVAYFLSDARICNLTLLVADRLDEVTGMISGVATRLRFDVAAGSDVKVDTGAGKSLAFACATDAASMTVKALSQVAVYVPGK